MRILGDWEMKATIIHTALDDLESFLWVLIWGIVQVLKDNEGAKDANKGIQLMLNAWSGGIATNGKKHPAARKWNDAVFGGIIKEWLGIFERANAEAEKIVNLLPSIPLENHQGSPWNDACNWLKSHCTKTYEDILESGFNHLERVRDYPDWEAVVAANVQAQAQNPAQALAMALAG